MNPEEETAQVLEDFAACVIPPVAYETEDGVICSEMECTIHYLDVMETAKRLTREDVYDLQVRLEEKPANCACCGELLEGADGR